MGELGVAEIQEEVLRVRRGVVPDGVVQYCSTGGDIGLHVDDGLVTLGEK